MKIREASPEEAREITNNLWLPLAREMEEVSDYNELKKDYDIQRSVDYKKDKLKAENSHIFLAENSELIGYISATVKDSNPAFLRDKKLKISELFVKENYRKKGIASRLMERTIELAEKKEVDSIELDVNVRNNAAQQLYKKHGFEVERHRMIKEN